MIMVNEWEGVDMMEELDMDDVFAEWQADYEHLLLEGAIAEMEQQKQNERSL
jgi:hypothetical protein